MSAVKKILLTIISLPLLLAGYFYLDYQSFLSSEPSTFKDEIIITIPPKATFHDVVTILSENGLPFDKVKLKLFARLNKIGSKIKSGEFLLKRPFTPSSIFRTLIDGHSLTYKITIPEGFNIYEIAQALEKNKISNYQTFISKCFDADLIASFGIQNISMEGYLFPDTYNFTKDTPAVHVIKTMYDNFKSQVPESFYDKANTIGFSFNEIITLASVIEKETGKASERKLISSVFHNRLKLKMKLQSDPTIIYGIDNYSGNIQKHHIRAKTPYNTYVIPRLPVGPIANPGLEAIEATLNPLNTKYLYFVSKNDGSHFFSTNLKDHERAVRIYQLKMKR